MLTPLEGTRGWVKEGGREEWREGGREGEEEEEKRRREGGTDGRTDGGTSIPTTHNFFHWSSQFYSDWVAIASNVLSSKMVFIHLLSKMPPSWTERPSVTFRPTFTTAWQPVCFLLTINKKLVRTGVFWKWAWIGVTFLEFQHLCDSNGRKEGSKSAWATCWDPTSKS